MVKRNPGCTRFHPNSVNQCLDECQVVQNPILESSRMSIQGRRLGGLPWSMDLNVCVFGPIIVILAIRMLNPQSLHQPPNPQTPVSASCCDSRDLLIISSIGGIRQLTSDRTNLKRLDLGNCIKIQGGPQVLPSSIKN